MTEQNSKTPDTLGRLVLVGAGKMGGAMLDGWLSKGSGARSIEVVDPAAPPELVARAQAGDLTVSGTMAETPLAEGDVLVLAVKPQIMDTVLADVAGLVDPGALVISVAAGISVGAFEKALGQKVSIIRAMPNLPSSIGLGMTVAVGNGVMTEPQKRVATRLLAAVGEVAWIEDEAHMDAVTALSGSGPAYVFHMIEAMAKAGEALGLEPGLAGMLAVETVRGAGVLAATSDLSPSTLRENVTSPGGTTKAALDVLMGEAALEDLMGTALKAAADRSRELGK